MYYILDHTENQYKKIIDYAVDTSDYFMLVYWNNYQAVKKNVKNIKHLLNPFVKRPKDKIKFDNLIIYNEYNLDYSIKFYRCDDKVKEILFKTDSLFRWEYPKFPEYLCFCRKDRCWLFTTPHEEIAGIENETEQDKSVFYKLGIIDISCSVQDYQWDFIVEGLE